MKILLVDDEQIALQGLIMAAQELGDLVSDIYSASNAKEAKKILDTEMIDVLVTDIEMPMGSGLTLLRTLREEGIEIECIFQTCHENFSFAREALSLGSSDYLVKPIQPSELREALEKAKKNIEDKRRAKNAAAYNNMLKKHQTAIDDAFLLGILRRNYQGQGKGQCMEAYLHEYGIETDPYHGMGIVSICIRRIGETILQWERDVLDFALRNIILEMLQVTQKERICQTNVAGVLSYAVLVVETDTSIAQIEENSRKLVRWFHQEMDVDVQILIGGFCGAKRLADQYEQLNQIQQDAIWTDVPWVRRQEAQRQIRPVDDHEWIILIRGKKNRDVLKQVWAYLNAIQATAVLTRAIFSTVVRQVKNSTAKAYEAWSIDETEYEKRFAQALYSEKQAQDFLEWLIFMGKDQENTKSLTEQIRQYIEEHIAKEIPRSELEETFHLNRDYLNRTFKKDTGYSLADYIVMRKIETAKEMLAMTELPVGEIGYWVGYENNSYFSRLFKKITGMTPAEYRKESQTEQ